MPHLLELLFLYFPLNFHSPAYALLFILGDLGHLQTNLDHLFWVIHARAVSHKPRASEAPTALFYGLASLCQKKKKKTDMFRLTVFLTAIYWTHLREWHSVTFNRYWNILICFFSISDSPAYVEWFDSWASSLCAVGISLWMPALNWVTVRF